MIPARFRAVGFTLVEVVVSFFVFSLALSLLAGTLLFSKNLLRDTVESSNASQRLRKVYLQLQEDLDQSSFSRVDRLQLAASPGSGRVGDAIWFLSSYDSATQRSVRSSLGQPFWQRNILYYVAVPTDHETLYGSTCTGGSNADGYDSHCPHKMLIRKVIDRGVATVPTDEITEETLLTATEAQTFMTAPTGFSVAAGGNVESAHVVSPGILTFRVALGPIAGPIPGEIHFSTQATALLELGKSVALGVTDLERAPQTETMNYSLFPQNP